MSNQPKDRAIRSSSSMRRLEDEILLESGVLCSARIECGHLYLTCASFADFTLARKTAVEKAGFDRGNVVWDKEAAA